MARNGNGRVQVFAAPFYPFIKGLAQLLQSFKGVFCLCAIVMRLEAIGGLTKKFAFTKVLIVKVRQSGLQFKFTEALLNLHDRGFLITNEENLSPIGTEATGSPAILALITGFWARA